MPIFDPNPGGFSAAPSLLGLMYPTRTTAMTPIMYTQNEGKGRWGGTADFHEIVSPRLQCVVSLSLRILCIFQPLVMIQLLETCSILA